MFAFMCFRLAHSEMVGSIKSLFSELHIVQNDCIMRFLPPSKGLLLRGLVMIVTKVTLCGIYSGQQFFIHQSRVIFYRAGLNVTSKIKHSQ